MNQKLGSLQKKRKGLIPKQGELRIPLVEEPLKVRHAGGAAWRDQFIDGFPMIGEPAEPGVHPISSQKVPEPISREKLRQSAASRFEPTREATGANSPKL